MQGTGEGRSFAEYVLESHALLRSVSENAPAGMAMLDPSFRFVRVNPKLAELNGIPAEAHLGRTPRELFPNLPHDEMEACWRRILDTGEPVLGYEFSGETPAAPGRTRWWREDWYPVSALGRVTGLAVVVTEITEEKRAAELQRLLVGIVGHDLRNPLAVITTSVRMLQGGHLDERQAVSATRIEKAARRIEALARDLLDYTRVSGGGSLPVERGDCSLSRIVEAAADEVRAAHRGAVIVCRGGGDARGRWDGERIQQLAGNLLSNAATHGARGEPIAARWHAAGGDVVLEVHNGGPPIPPERIAHVFDGPSQRAHEPSGQGGIGLGLFICREIVRAHGGSIEVASTAAGGTTVRVRLPREPAAA